MYSRSIISNLPNARALLYAGYTVSGGNEIDRCELAHVIADVTAVETFDNNVVRINHLLINMIMSQKWRYMTRADRTAARECGTI